MPPTFSDRLAHILQAIADLDHLMEGKTKADYARERALQLATERALEIISEASRHMPEAAKAKRPDISWIGMANLGNRLRHVCHRVDTETIWTIVHEDVPALAAFIRELARQQDES